MINGEVVATYRFTYSRHTDIWIAFGAFPHQKGGETPAGSYHHMEPSRWGGYVNGLGYYWAGSEYFDTKLPGF